MCPRNYYGSLGFVMCPRNRVFVFCLLICSFCFAKDKVTLEKVEGSRSKRATIEGVIHAPVKKIWAVLTDYASYPEFMPRFRLVNILEKSDKHVHYYSELNMPWPIKDVSYECMSSFLKVEEKLRVAMVPGTGKGVKSFEGTWILKPIDEQTTQASYTLFFESEKKYPKWAERMGTKSTIGKTLRAVRKRVALLQSQEN